MNRSARLRSLRWQLPLSYAAIALLAVLALGAALLGSLRGFYRSQERAYLTSNAAVIADELAPLLAAGDRPSLQSRIDAFSFLTQTELQVYDENGQAVIAASGEPGSFAPAIVIESGQSSLTQMLGIENVEVEVVSEEESKSADGSFTSQRVITRTNRLPAQASLYGFELGAEPSAIADRSDLAVEMNIVDASGSSLGYVRLSQGPAYGSEILRSVAWGWAIAGAAAVLLAAAIGWLFSRRLTEPLLALTAITGRMADGDLSARASDFNSYELGILGKSFNQMAEQVENTVNSLRRFTADAAHELHTPLTALQTDLHLLAGGVDQSQKERVARAEEQAKRLQDLADSLLELSQLEAEMTAGARPSIDLATLVQAAGELYASRAEQAGLAFDMQLQDQPVYVQANEAELRRALANILDNSLKFTPLPGEITLSLAAENNSAVVTIRDTGIGIPDEDIAQLFNRFHRGRNAAGYAGSGLGLAIVQEIMVRHGGQARVIGRDVGTEVRLILPCL
jgi:signal transduction histidine kinase